MKKIGIYLLTFTLAAFVWACDDDDPSGKSIFNISSPERNEFDNWLLENYTNPYNVSYKYRMEDIESDMTYNLVPARVEDAVKLAKIIKFMWLDAYDELMGIDFLRSYSPRVLHIIGSKAIENKKDVLGVAEGGMKITLYNVNNINPSDMENLNYYFLKTMHHEFAHIMHQTKSYPREFNEISGANYTAGNWINLKDDEALQKGFITPYGSSAVEEDIAETISVYVTHSKEYWDQQIIIAGDGAEFIIKKLEILKDYLRDSWNLNLEQLRDIVQRRTGELSTLDLDNL